MDAPEHHEKKKQFSQLEQCVIFFHDKVYTNKDC